MDELTTLERIEAIARRDRQVARESRWALRYAKWAYRLQWVAPGFAASLLYRSEIKRDESLSCHDEPLAAWVR